MYKRIILQHSLVSSLLIHVFPSKYTPSGSGNKKEEEEEANSEVKWQLTLVTSTLERLKQHCNEIAGSLGDM